MSHHPNDDRPMTSHGVQKTNAKAIPGGRCAACASADVQAVRFTGLGPPMVAVTCLRCGSVDLRDLDVLLGVVQRSDVEPELLVGAVGTVLAVLSPAQLSGALEPGLLYERLAGPLSDAPPSVQEAAAEILAEDPDREDPRPQLLERWLAQPEPALVRRGARAMMRWEIAGLAEWPSRAVARSPVDRMSQLVHARRELDAPECEAPLLQILLGTMPSSSEHVPDVRELNAIAACSAASRILRRSRLFGAAPRGYGGPAMSRSRRGRRWPPSKAGAAPTIPVA